ncbi:MAG: hypothetical protein HYT79_08620 [Elusimicrobia bacterium]|nr:hypothetical protein [Elusimicrobiota bacterium]
MLIGVCIVSMIGFLSMRPANAQVNISSNDGLAAEWKNLERTNDGSACPCRRNKTEPVRISGWQRAGEVTAGAVSGGFAVGYPLYRLSRGVDMGPAIRLTAVGGRAGALGGLAGAGIHGVLRDKIGPGWSALTTTAVSSVGAGVIGAALEKGARFGEVAPPLMILGGAGALVGIGAVELIRYLNKK